MAVNLTPQYHEAEVEYKTAVFCRFEAGRPRAWDLPEAFRAKLETPSIQG